MQPIGVLVLTDDLAATRSFLGRLGFDEQGRRPGSDTGQVFVRPTASPAAARAPYDRGPVALDLYVRSIEEALADLAGVDHGPIEEIVLGPLVMRQVMVHGPAGLTVVLIETDHRRASLLDSSDVHISEVHSTVWIVDDVDAVVGVLREDLLLDVPFDMSFPSPAVTRVMGMPDADVLFRMAMGQRPDGRPTRIEPMGVDRHGRPWDPSLRAGLRGAVLDAPAPGLDWSTELPGLQRALKAGIELWAISH